MLAQFGKGQGWDPIRGSNGYSSDDQNRCKTGATASGASAIQQ
jgi:hypothetical protein